MACSENPSKPPDIPDPAYLTCLTGSTLINFKDDTYYYVFSKSIVKNIGEEYAFNCYGVYVLLDSLGYLITFDKYDCNPIEIAPGEFGVIVTENMEYGYGGWRLNKTNPFYLTLILSPGSESHTWDVRTNQELDFGTAKAASDIQGNIQESVRYLIREYGIQ